MTVLKIAERQPKVVFWKYQLSEGTARIWYHHKTTLEGYGDHLGHKRSYELIFQIKLTGYSDTALDTSLSIFDSYLNLKKNLYTGFQILPNNYSIKWKQGGSR